MVNDHSLHDVLILHLSFVEEDCFGIVIECVAHASFQFLCTLGLMPKLDHVSPDAVRPY